MDRVPTNHRLAERYLIALVHEGEWAIRADGTIWRVGKPRTGPARYGRAEKVLPSGYLMVRAMRNGRRICALAHRLVWQHFHGDIPAGMTINHLNGLRDDNRPENLSVSTYSDQARHAHRCGLMDQHGQSNPAAKLTNNQVAAIRTAYASGGHTMEALARRFGVTFQHVSKLVRGQRRLKQGGAIRHDDQRHCVSDRDAETGRFRKSDSRHLDGVEHSAFPEVRP